MQILMGHNCKKNVKNPQTQSTRAPVCHFSVLSFIFTDDMAALMIYYLGHGGLRVQHEVLEGSLEHPTQLVEERAVVGDGAGLGAGGTLLVLDDAVQLGSGVA